MSQMLRRIAGLLLLSAVLCFSMGATTARADDSFITPATPMSLGGWEMVIMGIWVMIPVAALIAVLVWVLRRRNRK